MEKFLGPGSYMNVFSIERIDFKKMVEILIFCWKMKRAT